MSRAWRWALPLAWPLLTVNVIAAVLYAVAWCRAHSWAWRDGVLTFVAGRRADGSTRLVGDPGGQGWSPIVGYASELERGRPDLRVHENTHVVQEVIAALIGGTVGVVLFVAGLPVAGSVAAFCGGPAWALTYGADFLRHYVTADHWHDAYRAIVFEVHAYRVQAEFLQGKRPGAWGSL